MGFILQETPVALFDDCADRNAEEGKQLHSILVESKPKTKLVRTPVQAERWLRPRRDLVVAVVRQQDQTGVAVCQATQLAHVPPGCQPSSFLQYHGVLACASGDQSPRLAMPKPQEPGKRGRASPPPLHPDQIIAWAREHYARTGAWPGPRMTGIIPGTHSEKWKNLDWALRAGRRGAAPGPAPRLPQSRRPAPPHRRTNPGLGPIATTNGTAAGPPRRPGSSLVPGAGPGPRLTTPCASACAACPAAPRCRSCSPPGAATAIPTSA
jgi:hypothetical protein